MDLTATVRDSRSERKTPVSLRPYQVDALNATLDIWRTGDRALVVMPCGAGKTVVAAEAAVRTGSSLVVVFVPTLALVRQTFEAWRTHLGSALGDTFAVCSNAALVECGLTAHAATTDPDLLAMRLAARTGPTTLVVATYHSAAALARAQQHCSNPVVFDLVVYDEAHHLAGGGSSAFAAAWDVAAHRRLFLTATPTATGDTTSSFIPVRGRNEFAASMDDEQLFGPLAYHLSMSEATAAGVLVPWRVVVRASDAGAGEHHGHADQVAAACEVLRAAAQEMSLRSMLVYVNRVRDATRLVALLERYGPLEDGTAVVADVVAAATSPSRRAEILAALAGRDMLRVVVNVDCLAEGVDIPTLDAVMFANGRSSRVAITQIVGRVTRPASGKTAGVIVLPVALDIVDSAAGAGGPDHDAVLHSSRLGTVWATCRALRDIDEGFAAVLHQASRFRARGGPVVPLPGWDVDLPDVLADEVLVSCVDHVADTWWQWFGRVEAAAAAAGTVDSIGSQALRGWCAGQRRARQRGVLAVDKAAALSELPGWFWVRGFDLASESLRALLAQWPDGGLDAHAGSTVPVPGWPRSLGVLAAWARVARRRGRLDADIAAALGALNGWVWDVVDPSDAAEVDALDRFRAWERHVDVPAGHVEHGVDLGAAVSRWRCERAAGTLSAVLADEIVAASSGRFRWKTTEVRWASFLEVLRAWCAVHGHARGIGDVVCDTASGPVHLGQWVNRVRFEHRHGMLAPRWCAELEKVDGWGWAASAPRVFQDLAGARHGTRSGYVRGCRCDACTVSNNQYRAERALRAPAERCDAAQAAAHLARLVAAGLSVRHVSALLGVSRSSLTKLARSARGHVSRKTFDALAGADPDVMFAEIVARAHVDDRWAAVFVPSDATMKRIDELVARSWPKSWIARECGLGGALQLRSLRVRAGSAARVLKLYEAVAGVDPPRRQARTPFPPLADIVAGTDVPPG